MTIKEPSWIDLGVELHPEGQPDFIFKVVKIDTTGNGARMIHMVATFNPEIPFSRWEAYLLNGQPDIGTLAAKKWLPVKPPAKTPETLKNRFDLVNAFDDL